MIIWINNNNEEFFIQKNSHLEKQLPFFHSISLHIKVLRRKKITINYLLTTMIIETKTKDHRNILFKDILSWNILLNVSHDPFVTFEKKKKKPHSSKYIMQSLCSQSPFAKNGWQVTYRLHSATSVTCTLSNLTMQSQGLHSSSHWDG